MLNLYIIAGCNGAGKTTASFSVLPDMLNCREFVNADEIARGLSPFQPEKVSFEAGRIMLSRIKDLMKQKVDFAFETTLATKSYVPFIKEAKIKGYFVTLLYFWLSSPELAMDRVKTRVKSGGHDIPEEIIKRRYLRGMNNLSKLYLPICNYWMVIDNSKSLIKFVAEGDDKDTLEIKNEIIYNKIIKA